MRALLITDKPVSIMVAADSRLGITDDVLFVPRDAGWATAERSYEATYPDDFVAKRLPAILESARAGGVPTDIATLATTPVFLNLTKHVWTWHETTITTKES